MALDGTKIHANASRHGALSYEHAGKIEAQLRAEVAELMARAEAVDQADVPDGMSIPDELARREERLAKLNADPGAIRPATAASEIRCRGRSDGNCSCPRGPWREEHQLAPQILTYAEPSR